MDGAGDRVAVRVSSPSNRVRIVAEDRADVAVEGRAEQRRTGSVLSIEGVRSALVVRVPQGADVQVGTESGRVQVEGTVGQLAVITSSGRVQVEAAESADIRTSSGRIEVGAVAGEARLRTASGRVTVGSCGGADVSTESGRVQVYDARGDVGAHCVTGRVQVEMAHPADVVAETVTGRIQVSMPSGTRVHRPEAGESGDSRPDDCDCVVRARSVTGRVTVGAR